MKDYEIIEKLEKKIWEAANILRGAADTSVYRFLIVGLVFLKYWDELGKMPKGAGWNILEETAKERPEDTGQTIDRAMIAIEEANPFLEGALYKRFAAEEVDQRKLAKVVQVFSDMEFLDESVDGLGAAYEYCLDKFAEKANQYTGEFYTPASIVALLLKLLRPDRGIVYDPCCGSGNLLAGAAKYMESHGDKRDYRLYGQDSSPGAWKLARMNLATRGMDAELGESAADTFYHDYHKDIKADYILANPPFHQTIQTEEGWEQDARWMYGIPPKGNGNFAWMQHILSHMKDGGKAGVVLDNSALSSTYQGEGDIRKKMIEAGVVEAIISLPPQMFHTTQMPVSIWILTKGEKRDSVVFINGEGLGKKVSRKLLILDEADIARICKTYGQLLAGGTEGEKGFSASVCVTDIEKNRYQLNPARYVGRDTGEEMDIEEIEAELTRLMEELAEMFEEEQRLQGEIKSAMTSFLR